MDFLYGKNDCIVDTSKGKVRGYRLDGVYQFKGIPYAEAKRFHAPEETNPWEGIIDVLTIGPTCPYIAKKTNAFKDMRCPHLYWPQDENCLNLNIWTDTLDKDARKPVLVFVHGGGYDTGNCMELASYDGANSARDGGMVFVSINHRLNMLGLLDLSAFDNRYENSGSLSIQDIEAALRWIKDNISGFGGDPFNVTVLGQSGGGGKIQALMASPSADGLYQKAIIQSGVFRSRMKKEDAQEMGCLIAEILGAVCGEDLESVPFEKLMEAYAEAKKRFADKGRTYVWEPVPDSYFMGMALDTGITEYAKTVPLLIGSNMCEIPVPDFPEKKNEMPEEEVFAILRKKYGDRTDAVISEFKAAYPDKNILDVMIADLMFRKPTLDYLDLRAAEGAAPAYSYIFAYEFPYRDGETAWHSSEMPFIFRNIETTQFCHFDGAREIEKTVSSIWSGFIKNGDPNTGGTPEWTPYTEDSRGTMVLSERSYIKDDLDRKLIEEIDDVNSRITFVHE